MAIQSEPPLDPVSSYDDLGNNFAQLTAKYRPYLDAIDALITANLPAGSASLMDVGAGDARRSRSIAAAAGIGHLALVEPSEGMRRTSSTQSGFMDLRAEQLRQVSAGFDVILCLWNVPGHIFPESARIEVFRQFRRLVAPGGRIFVDVTHRYNAARYGWVRTAGRFLYDCIRPSERNGDVVASWNFGGRDTRVLGHVFTDREFRRLAAGAGLRIDKRFVVNYETGRESRFPVCGNLLYIMSNREPA